MDVRLIIWDVIVLSATGGAMRGPFLARPGIFFGVTVDPGFPRTAEAKGILSVYRAIVVATAIATLITAHVVAWIGASAQGTKAATTFSSCAILFTVQLAAWLIASRQTRRFARQPSLVRTASLQPGERSLPGGLWFFGGPILISLMAGVVLAFRWESIPSSFAIVWDQDGNPIRWASRAAILSVLIATASLNLLLMLISYKATFQSRSSGSHFQRTSYIGAMAIAYSLSIESIGLTVLNVLNVNRVAIGVNTGFIVVVLPLLIMMSIMFYLFRLSPAVASAREGGFAGDGTKDECWKLGGIIYFNPDDSSFFVESRLGVGWNVNVANKRFWFLLAVVLLGPFALNSILHQVIGLPAFP